MYLDFQLPPDTPFNMAGRLLGSEDIQSETVAAYESGYRHQLGKRLSLDVAAFYNDYRQLTTIRRGQPFLELGAQPHKLRTYEVYAGGELHRQQICTEQGGVSATQPVLGCISFLYTVTRLRRPS